MKRIGVELVWFFVLCALGAFIWFAIASGYNEASDAYWSANGHPPPTDMYRAPWEWRFVILFAPYVARVAIRVLAAGARSLRGRTVHI